MIILEQLARKLSEKGKRRAQDFTVERAVEEYLKLIGECVGTRL
ncbi:hypothetical protein QBE54_09850 [Thermatribacter velox]|uniref:Uncharacterized protein n=1 Tax=Thermatribacter velox TaxID=3039681 RepID=A0ABZ2YDS8_9BACT